MHCIAKYSFNRDFDDLLKNFKLIENNILEWVKSKTDEADKCTDTYERSGSITITLKDQRQAIVTIDRYEKDIYAHLGVSIKEPYPNQQHIPLTTDINVNANKETIAIDCEFKMPSQGKFSPNSIKVQCPRFIRDIIKQHGPWHINSTEAPSSAVNLTEEIDGTDLCDNIINKSRTLPIVVVSDLYDTPIVNGIEDKLAYNLTGLASVYHISESVSWKITNTLGKEFSCYNGAFRLYWPFSSYGNSPAKHPLWTVQKIIYPNKTYSEGATSLVKHLTATIIRQTPISVSSHPLLEEVNKARKDEQIRKASDAGELADLYSKDAENFKNRVAELENENNRLRKENFDLTATISSLNQINTSQAPFNDLNDTPEIPPQTVEEAVETAKELYGKYLVFGEDIERGISSLDRNAGPPDKILSHLKKLAILADKKTATSDTHWLNSNGVPVSSESETTANNRNRRSKRTFHDGKSKVIFENHTKPSEGTSPGRCARIYYKWRSDIKKFAIGWIGRHPED